MEKKAQKTKDTKNCKRKRGYSKSEKTVKMQYKPHNAYKVVPVLTGAITFSLAFLKPFF